MKNHDGCRRGFFLLSEAYYARSSLAVCPDLIDEIQVGMYHRDGGTTGEFAIRWIKVGGKPVPRLEVFDDGWHALSQFGDLLQWMASVDGEAPSPQLVANMLRSFGVEDLTQRTNPRASPAEREYASWGCQ